MWRFPGKEGRRNLPVTALWADGYPHQLKANKEGRDKNNRVQACCLDNHSVKLLWYWEGWAASSRPRWSGEVRITAGVCVFYLPCLWHTMQEDHTVLVVCGISRFKIGQIVGGGQKQREERERGWWNGRGGEEEDKCLKKQLFRTNCAHLSTHQGKCVVCTSRAGYNMKGGKLPSLLNFNC